MAQQTFNDGDALSVVRATINGNANDAQGKLVDQVSIRTLADLAPFLVSGTYELPSGTYYFNNTIDFGTADILLISLDGCYDFRTSCITTLTYTGITPFITSGNTGQVITFSPYRVTTPNSLTFDGDGFAGNSLIIDFGIFVSCKEMIRLTDWAFFTVDAFAGVGCETGCTLNNVANINISKPQWNLGLNSGGVMFTCLGASSGRIIADNMNSQPAPSESFWDIQATYGGDAIMGLGVHTVGFGNYFKTGSRNQTDVDILSLGVKNVEDSKYSGHIIANGNTTETSISTQNAWVDINFDASLFESINMERWSLDDSDNGETSYTGKENFGGEIDGTFSVLSPGSQNYQLRYVIDTGSGFVTLPDSVVVPFATDSATGTFPIHIPMTSVTGDKIKPQVRNVDGEDNITFTHFSAGPTNQ